MGNYFYFDQVRGEKAATKLVAGISGWLSISDSKLEFWYPFLVGIPISG